MENLLQIKNRILGSGKPLMCVSVLESDREAVVSEFNRLVAAKVPMIEWRVDAFADVENLDAVNQVLSEVRELMTDTILVFTFRSEAQGGLCVLERTQIRDLQRLAAESHAVDLIDLEYCEIEDIHGEIERLHTLGVGVIASHHDFTQTPETEVMYELLTEMGRSGADVVKLAVMPQNAEDVLRLLTVTNRFHTQYPKRALITMSMGKMGSISRISGEIFGSCVTFGAGKAAGAPGQIGMEDLRRILDII